jgi:hypothetical protein
MVDHRRTPSQRAYQLPSWFFVLTAVLSVLAFLTVGWVFVADRFEGLPGVPQATSSPPASTAEPTLTDVRPTSPSGGDGPRDEERSGIDVVVLNASEEVGLAASVADAAKEAGWTVDEVGDWIYPAVINAVYYPEGHQPEAELLADDLGIDGIRPARPGMSTDALTVLLVYSP